MESFALAAVAELLPGATTVTPHARYFALHALVGVEGDEQDLGVEERLALLRRCEVVVGAAATMHARLRPELHEGLAAAHGADVIAPQLVEGGTVDVSGLAEPGQYAASARGFLGPYLASERTLGLVVDVGSAVGAGPRARRRLLRDAFPDLLSLAGRDSVAVAELQDRPEWCVCGVSAAERDWLRSVFVAPEMPAVSDERRSQTLRLLARLVELHTPRQLTVQAAEKLVSDRATYTDSVVAGLEVAAAWRGVILRSWYVEAWRSLWAWTINSMPAAVPAGQLGDRLADTLTEHLTAPRLGALIEALPDGVGADGQPTAADREPPITDLPRGCRELAQLIIGARRAGRLPQRVADYFEDPLAERRNRQLTPTAFADWLDQRRDQSSADVARELTAMLLHRSQRVALSKGRFHTDGWKIPTRLASIDGRLVTDSLEPGGGISLRWETAAQVMIGLGITCWSDTKNRWTLTDGAP
ncbi:hypothetical protein ACFFOM_12115 [Microlunatus capsulatus]|uniref:Uncharacterized protein n=1 Tax=Microlunatus capsulatus TaxID=99117 RepID=A0ABS4Z9Q5_9ACTN|nr:hypothetical protein [Microlunatus capsulatus]MBP2417510.1 hypothetical protein [Microlunatus capsulatus]